MPKVHMFFTATVAGWIILVCRDLVFLELNAECWRGVDCTAVPIEHMNPDSWYVHRQRQEALTSIVAILVHEPSLVTQPCIGPCMHT